MNKAKCLFVFALLTGMAHGEVAHAQTARLEVIHNAADPTAAIVEVYLNSAFRLCENLVMPHPELVEGC